MLQLENPVGWIRGENVLRTEHKKSRSFGRSHSLPICFDSCCRSVFLVLLSGISFLLLTTPSEASQSLALVLEQSKPNEDPEWQEKVRRLIADTIQIGEVNNLSTLTQDGLNQEKTCIEFRTEDALKRAKSILKLQIASKDFAPLGKAVRLHEAKNCVASRIHFLKPIIQEDSTTTGASR